MTGMEIVATWENQKSPFWKKNIVCMVWKNLLCILEMAFSSLISQKPGELFKRFFFQFCPIFHWKSAILSSAMIMTSLLRCTWDVGTYFGMYGKRRPLATLWYHCMYRGFIFKFTGGGNHPPLGKLGYKTKPKKKKKKEKKKGELGMTRVKDQVECAYRNKSL